MTTWISRLFTAGLPLAAIALLEACSGSQKAVVQHVSLDTLSVTAKPLPPNRYNVSEPVTWDITHTRVALQFDWQNKTANGRAWLDMHPYFYDTDSIILDAKGMKIDTVRLQHGGSDQILSYSYQNDKLRIGLPARIHRQDSIRLYVRYASMPYATAAGGSSAISEDRGLYFINTDHAIPGKPSEIWTQGETQSNSHWLPTFDQPNERFTTEVELLVPDSMTTLGNGSLVKSSREANGMRTDVWAIDKPIQAYAVMFAIGKFSVIKDNWRGKEVSYYVEPQYASSAPDIFRHTPDMIEHFSQITGVPYPWNKYSQVIVRDYVSGAMENTTASLFGEFMNETSREIRDHNFEDVVSHELFHQWFGDYATTESWANLTVNESFADYGETLWRLHYYGRESGHQHLWENLNKYLAQARESDPSLVRFDYADREEMFDRTTYEKGGCILHYLNGLTGDSAFYRAMQLYLTQNALHATEAHQWRLAVEEATGLDWNWFFNQWYFHGGHPELSIHYEYNDSAHKLIVHADQVQRDSSFTYRLPLKVLLINGSQRQVIDWDLRKRHEVFEYPYLGTTKPLIVPDVEHWMVGPIKEDKKSEQWLAEYTQSGDYLSKRFAIREAFLNKDDNSLELFRKAVQDSSRLLREYCYNLLSTLSAGSKWAETFRPQALFAAENDASNLVRARAIDALGKWKAQGATPLLMSSVQDSSYAVSGAALNALNRVAPDTAYTLARHFTANDPHGDLEGAVWKTIATRAAPEDIALFEQQKNKVYGTRSLTLGGHVQDYTSNVANTESVRRGCALLQELAARESIKTYRYYLSMILGNTAIALKQTIDTAPSDKTAAARERYDVAVAAFKKMLQQEPDAENKENLQKAYKQLLQ